MSILGSIIGSTVIGGIGSLIGGKESGQDIKQGYGEAIDALEGVKGEQQQLYSPWIDAGKKALQAMQDTGEFDFTNLDTFIDPSYEFRLQEGVNALDQSASARGNLMSGAQQQAVTDYGQNLASQEYGNAFDRAFQTYNTNLGKQQHLTGVGQNALGGYSNALSNYGSNIANMYADQGNKLAGNTQKTVGGVGNSLQTGIGNYLLSDLIKKG